MTFLHWQNYPQSNTPRGAIVLSPDYIKIAYKVVVEEPPMQITLEIPDLLVEQLQSRGENIPRKILEVLVLEAYSPLLGIQKRSFSNLIPLQNDRLIE